MKNISPCMKNISPCPCGSAIEKDQCCALYHAGAPVPTALALMRARYTAYVVHDIDFIERSSSKEFREEFNRLDAERWSAEAEWQKLEIIRTVEGGELDQTGQVEFKVYFKHNGRSEVHYERAGFSRENNAWVYSACEINPKGAPVVRDVTAGRNDPCPCGSGKKFKKCCGG